MTVTLKQQVLFVERGVCVGIGQMPGDQTDPRWEFFPAMDIYQRQSVLTQCIPADLITRDTNGISSDIMPPGR
ncbi:MAG: hypothetical protein EA377_09660 [Phycisphaerales bacterium]|nr:MAG: hypothetical protein EA377_09660 [Phycisphaerales bacterium]